MKIETFLVIGEGSKGKPRVRKATSRYPALDVDEAVIALSLDIPDDIFDAPLFTVEVEKRQINVGIEAHDVEEGT
jgi:hypothetical protein